MKDLKMFKHNNWQLAVVDLDRLIEKYPKIMDEMKNGIESSIVKSGDVAYIAATFLKLPGSNPILNSITPRCYDGKIMMCQAWVPFLNDYIYAPMVIFHPICTEKDALEMSMKFGIDFDKL